jgi:hypothetical protein
MHTRTATDRKNVSTAAGVASWGPSRPCRKNIVSPTQLHNRLIFSSSFSERKSWRMTTANKVAEMSHKGDRVGRGPKQQAHRASQNPGEEKDREFIARVLSRQRAERGLYDLAPIWISRSLAGQPLSRARRVSPSVWYRPSNTLTPTTSVTHSAALKISRTKKSTALSTVIRAT